MRGAREGSSRVHEHILDALALEAPDAEAVAVGRVDDEIAVNQYGLGAERIHPTAVIADHVSHENLA